MFAISGIAPMEFLALWSASSTVYPRLTAVASAASGEAGLDRTRSIGGLARRWLGALPARVA